MLMEDDAPNIVVLEEGAPSRTGIPGRRGKHD
jgi:hypothetical protein